MVLSRRVAAYQTRPDVRLRLIGEASEWRVSGVTAWSHWVALTR